MSASRGIAYAAIGTICGLLGIAYAQGAIPSLAAAMGPTALYFIGLLER